MAYLSNLPPGCTAAMLDDATRESEAWPCERCGQEIDEVWGCAECGKELCSACAAYDMTGDLCSECNEREMEAASAGVSDPFATPEAA